MCPAGWRGAGRAGARRCPRGASRDEGRRRGSRRAGWTPGRCRPARRCVIPAPCGGAGMVPPPGARAAMLAAATRSRWPWCPQCGQVKFRPAGLGTRRAQDGQVEDVPRSSTRCTVIPAAWALSDRTRIRCPTRQSRVLWLCRRPAFRCRTPRGSPTARVPILCRIAQVMTSLAASCWACVTRRACRASAFRSRAGASATAVTPAVPAGGAGGGGPAAALAVAQVLAALGADGPPGHQQPLPVRAGDGIRVDDAQVDPGRPGRVRGLPVGVPRDGDLGGHVGVQAARVEAEGHRPDLARRVGEVAVEPDRQRRAASRDRDRSTRPSSGTCPHTSGPGPGPACGAGSGRSCRRPCGVSRWRTRRRSSGAAPTWPRGVEFPERARPGHRQRRTAPGIPPAACPAGAAARRSAPARSTTRRPPTPAARTPAPAGGGSPAARTAPCGTPPAAHPGHVFEA